MALLPSLRTSDTNGAGHHGDGGMDLRTTIALLPTPAVNDMGASYTPETWDEWTATMKAKHNNGNGHGKSLNVEAQRLLPTPRVTQPGYADDGRGGRSLDVEARLLSTPTVEMSIRSPEFARVGETPAEFAANYDGTWGPYAAAIARWEHALGRPAPAPTMTSAKGNPQLSPAFTEWMMGLPAGWITDTPGITRNEALKLCGNGVVPQQAVAALQWLRVMASWEAAA